MAKYEQVEMIHDYKCFPELSVTHAANNHIDETNDVLSKIAKGRERIEQ